MAQSDVAREQARQVRAALCVTRHDDAVAARVDNRPQSSLRTQSPKARDIGAVAQQNRGLLLSHFPLNANRHPCLMGGTLTALANAVHLKRPFHLLVLSLLASGQLR